MCGFGLSFVAVRDDICSQQLPATLRRAVGSLSSSLSFFGWSSFIQKQTHHRFFNSLCSTHHPWRGTCSVCKAWPSPSMSFLVIDLGLAEFNRTPNHNQPHSGECGAHLHGPRWSSNYQNPVPSRYDGKGAGLKIRSPNMLTSPSVME